MSMTKRSNTYRIEGDVAIISVGTKKLPDAFCYIDVVDLPRVVDGGGRWGAYRNPRALVTYVSRGCWAERKQIFLHRHLLGLTDPKIQVDHKDHDGLNDRRNNIRIATTAQNQANRRKYSRIPSSSKFKGVTHEEGRWRARVFVNGRGINCGSHITEEAAAMAYDEKLLSIHGEFAETNFPQGRP